MATFNVSLDDSSSLVTYLPSNAWIDTLYNDSSLHSVNVQGASASITFNGTGVWFYGSKNPDYGSYQLEVDNEVVASGSATSSSQLVDQLLGGASGLTMGQHTAVLTSNGDGTIDFDSLIFETQNATASGDAVDASAPVANDAQVAPADTTAEPSSAVPASDGPTPTVASFFSIIPTLGVPSLIVTTLPAAAPTADPSVAVDAVSASASPDIVSTEVLSFFSIVPTLGVPSLVLETTTVTIPASSADTALSQPTASPSAVAVDVVSASAAPSVSTEVISFFSVVPTAGVPSLIIETTTVAVPPASPSPSSSASAASNMNVDSEAPSQPDTSPSQSTTPAASTGKSSISTGALAAIITGAVVGVILLILLVYYLIRRCRARFDKVRRDRAQIESPVLPIQDPRANFSPASRAKGYATNEKAGKRVSAASEWSLTSGTTLQAPADAPAKWELPLPPSVGTRWELPLPRAGSPFGREVEDRLVRAGDDKGAFEQAWLSPGLQDRPFTPTRPPRPPGLDLNLPNGLV